MKPTKNRYFCRDAGRIKMLFSSEKKADTFMRFNSEVIEEESGFKPERSYYCIACAGWHVTSTKESFDGKSRAKLALDQYQELKLKRENARQLRTENRAKLDILLANLEEKVGQLEVNIEMEYEKALADLKSINELMSFSLKHHRDRKMKIEAKIGWIKDGNT